MNVMDVQRRPFDRSNGPPERAGWEAALSERSPLLVQYLSIARRRKWVIIGAIVAALVIGGVLTLLMTPKYAASATLEIQRESRDFTMVEGVQPGQNAGPGDLEFYQTQYGLLESNSLAERVATDLALFNNRGFFTMFGAPQAETWFAGDRVAAGASTREQRVRKAAEILLSNFSVQPERQSRLVTISFTSPDAAFSQRVTNSWSEHFIQSTLDRRYAATSYARNFLEERLASLREQINNSERQLVAYAAQQGIVNLPAAQAGDDSGALPERSLVADDLAALNRELASATADRIAAQSRLRSASSSAPEALENQAITGLRQRRAELAGDYAKMLVQFEPTYPPAVAIQEDIEQLDSAIAREESRVGQTIRGQYEATVLREQQLRARVDDLKGGLLDSRRRSIQYNIYQREAETNRELYNALLQRYKEIGVAGGVGVNNISIVDPAPLPERPSSPQLFLNLLIALLFGTLAGAGVAIALEQIDQGISDPSDVERLVGLPLLGTVPKIYDASPGEELQDRKSILSEAYVSLQTNLSFSTDHGIPRSLAITSSRPAEGKTTTSMALAIAIARNGRRVLLIDADMRSPSLHEAFDIDNERGFSNYLSGSDDLDQLVESTSIPSLSVMTAGPHPPSAPELLSSQRFEHLIQVLQQRYDNIIFDAPPVMGLADAPLVASRVEGVVFVIEANGTELNAVRAAVRRLVGANAQIMGATLTKFDQKRAQYGYGYEYGYGYGKDGTEDSTAA